jgi:squalene-hopene/tetraprenyl-beta-curcumene cyclase
MIANTDGGVSTRFKATPFGSPRRGEPAPVPDPMDRALRGARRWLLDAQHPDGYWVGELEGDTILESEYILLMAYLGRERDEVCLKAGQYLLQKQGPDGGWSNYPGGPTDLSASVKAYFALKLIGTSTQHPAMVRARESVLAAGGAQASNSFTRFYLALLGQISYDDCPSVPPELVLLPKRTPFGLYAMSSWTRKMVVTLSIISALKPRRELAPERGIAELFRADLPRRPNRWTRPALSWANTFLVIDAALKVYERVIPASWRRPAVEAAYRWMLEHLEGSDGLGAIFPPMIYTVIVLKAMGHADDTPLMTWALGHLEDLQIEEDGAVRLQPCVSPVWDTAIATIALADAGLADFHPALLRAVRWLLQKEVRRPGDWSVRRPGVEPSGWYFEFNNELFPDIDDTAMVLLALHKTALADSPEVQAATRRAVAWLLAMQNRDGGWAAFDVDINNQILTKVPFADHNAMLDPSCADITARILEVLGTLGYRADHPAIARALDYLWKSQEPEGCWYGRWGVNYIYGTWQVLLGLRAIDFPMDHPAVQRAFGWLLSVQQPGGGWGESCASYDDPSQKGIGTPTASQTAWAVLGLIAAGRGHSDAVRQGIAFLTSSQQPDGTWSEDAFTGTGFPRVFYLKYHLYRVYFPLMALSRYRAVAGRTVAPHAPAIASRIPALPLAREV